MAKFEMFPAGNGQYFFTFKSDFCGKVLESIKFASKPACNQAMQDFQKKCTLDSLYEKHVESQQNKHWFIVKDLQGNFLASSERYTSNHAMEISLNLLRIEAKKAALLDLT